MNVKYSKHEVECLMHFYYVKSSEEFTKPLPFVLKYVIVILGLVYFSISDYSKIEYKVVGKLI